MSLLSTKAALTFLLLVYGTKAKGVRSRHDAFVESNESILAEDNKSWTRYAMEEINSIAPTASPTTFAVLPTDSPTRSPTDSPTQKAATAVPTKRPTQPPTRNPTPISTGAPITSSPTQAPNPSPTTSSPTKRPTPFPTILPTPPPSPFPTAVVPVPTPNPTPPPTPLPTNPPTPPPSPNPTPGPTPAPTPQPTPAPTPLPTPVPTPNPTPPPTPPPTPQPTPSPTVPVQPTVEVKLTPYAMNTAAWEDPGSYQSQALRRTEEQIGSESMTDAKLVQYYSLYCIYTATNGVPNNITNDDPRFVNIAIPNWLFDNNWNENNVDPCGGSWYGIACSNDQVIGIDLSSNILTGIFPPEVSLLSSENPSGAGALRALVLLKNEFLYSEDNSWIADLGSNLLTLYFQETSLAGPLPKMPQNLFEFDCSFSLINGGLTDENFAGLNNLNYMVVSGLSLGSSIPSVFGSLQNLEFFYAADSLITGDLGYMQGMPSIRQHWVDDNPGLSGPLFPFIADIQTMESMSLTDNALTGSIPTEFGRMTNIEDLWLFGNKLTGTVPTEMGDLRRMKFFQVEGNDLTGVMPDQVCANTQFPSEVLTVLGADCSEVSCSCCDCCSYDTCPNKPSSRAVISLAQTDNGSEKDALDWWQPISENPRRSFIFSLFMGACGAALGPFLDSYHSAFGVLQYNQPITGILWGTDKFPALTTAWWVPELFGLAGFLIGWLYIIFDNALETDMEKTRPMPAHVFLGISAFTFQYWLSGILFYNGVSRAKILIVMALAASVGFFTFDATVAGFLTSSATAIGGPIIEVVLLWISSHGWDSGYHYNDTGETGFLPLWACAVYYLGGPANGNLARWIWNLLSQEEMENKRDPCPVCNDTRRVLCPNCDGVGKYTAMGGMDVDCTSCEGRGFVICRNCFDRYDEDPYDIEAIRQVMSRMLG